MIAQDEISNFRQYGLQEIDNQPIIPLNLIAIDGSEYQFLDCFNGSNKPFDFWDNKPEGAEEWDAEHNATFLAYPKDGGPFEYDNNFMDGEYPLKTIQCVFYKNKEYRTIQSIFDSLKQQEKDVHQIAHLMNEHLINHVCHIHVSGVRYLVEYVSVAKAIDMSNQTKDLLNLVLSTKHGSYSNVSYCDDST